MTNNPEKQAWPESFYARSRKEWRRWLEKNHGTVKSVRLIMYHKKSETPSVKYDEAVEEALCFGWVDSKPSERDAESFFLHFAQRNPKSNWSRLNKQRAEKLIKQGAMTQAGLALIKLAKQNGRWNALEAVQDSVIPGDLQAMFDRNKTAFRNFKAFPPSSKRIILEWILNAKKPETRRQRIKDTVTLAAKNIRANHYRP